VHVLYKYFQLTANFNGSQRFSRILYEYLYCRLWFYAVKLPHSLITQNTLKGDLNVFQYRHQSFFKRKWATFFWNLSEVSNLYFGTYQKWAIFFGNLSEVSNFFLELIRSEQPFFFWNLSKVRNLFLELIKSNQHKHQTYFLAFIAHSTDFKT
jgi:hypothetical protein